MSKNISIITITDLNNYGNRLQNYALQTQLNSMGYEVKTILNKTYKLSKLSKFKVFMKQTYCKLLYKNERIREKNFLSFTADFINSTNDYLYTVDSINKDKTTDIYIIGSDQIWNYNYRGDKFGNFEFCLFDRDKPIISYAASFGVSSIPDELNDIYKNGLNNLDYISVREQAGINLVKKISGKEATLVLDPTLLLSKKQWDKVIKKPNCLKSNKYILTYFLGDLSNERRNIIEKFAKKNNCQIIDILDKKSPFYSCGPSEFLYLEKNAFLICTDSFHSCIFSIIYNRPFIIFNREDCNISMNSRIDTLLEMFDLEDRRFNGCLTNEILNWDFKKVNGILNKERINSIEFLKSAIEK